MGLEGGEVVDDPGAEEGRAVREGGFIDDDAGTLGLDALHDALDGALAEVVGAGLHGQAVDAHRDLALAVGGPFVAARVAVVAGLLEDTVGDVVLAGAVALDDGLDEVLGDIVEIGQQLLRVLREAVAAVAETGIVVMGTDAGIQADALDNRPGIKAFHLRVGIQFIEIADPQRQVGVGEQLHRLGLGRAHQEHRHILPDGALPQETGEGAGGVGEVRIAAHDDSAGVEVVIQGLAFAEELGREEDARCLRPVAAAAGEPLPDPPGIADRHGGLDHHHRGGIDLHHQADDLLDMGGVEEIPDGIIIGRRGNDHERRIPVGRRPVQGRREVKLRLPEILLDVRVGDGALPAVDLVHLLRDDVHGHDLIPLRQQRRKRHTHIPCTRYCYFHK